MITSPDTLLRRLRHAVLVEHPTPKVLGVDDWAFRKGQCYGTIRIDLENHCPIDLLQDREAETLRAWLAAHLGVEIISRDHANTPAEAARKGAPTAIQIADRFHLLKNKARELRAQGETIAGIARQLGIHRRNVREYLQAAACPRRVTPAKRQRRLDPCRLYLKQRWEEGCHNVAELYREVGARGFTGSESILRDYMSAWREQLPLPLRRKRRCAAAAYPVPVPPPSARKATWLLLKKGKTITDEEQRFLSKLRECCPEIAAVEELPVEFFQIVNNRQAKKNYRINFFIQTGHL